MHAAKRAHKGTYSAYNTKTRTACHECVAVLHEAKGKGEPPRGARVSRSSPAGRLLLCHGHADLWRVLDGVGKR